MRILLLALLSGVTAWADPTLFFPVGGGSIGYPGVVAGPCNCLGGTYTSFNMPTVTSSIDMPLHPGTTGTVKMGGGLYFSAAPLIGSDATHWYFGNDGFMGIEDGIDFANDDNVGPLLFGPDDIGGFSLFNAPVIGTPTVTAVGSAFTLTMSFGPLELNGSSNLDLLDAYYGMDPSTQWYGNLTLNFTGVGSPGGTFHNTSGVTGALVETAVPEPGSVFLLGTIAMVFIGSVKRRLLQCAKVSIALLGLTALMTHPARADTMITFIGFPGGGATSVTTDDPREIIGCFGDGFCRTTGAFRTGGAGIFGQDPHDGEDYLAAGNPATKTVDEVIGFFPIDFIGALSDNYKLDFSTGPSAPGFGTPCAEYEGIVLQNGCYLKEDGSIQDLATIHWTDGGVDHIRYQYLPGVPEPTSALLLLTVVAVVAFLSRRKRPASY
jgi:hypothetical protein